MAFKQSYIPTVCYLYKRIVIFWLSLFISLFSSQAMHHDYNASLFNLKSKWQSRQALHVPAFLPPSRVYLRGVEHGLLDVPVHALERALAAGDRLQVGHGAVLVAHQLLERTKEGKEDCIVCWPTFALILTR